MEIYYNIYCFRVLTENVFDQKPQLADPKAVGYILGRVRRASNIKIYPTKPLCSG